MTELLTQSEAALRDAAALAVELAGRRGATARASVHHEGVAKIAMRDGEVETAERSGTQGLGLTVHAEIGWLHLAGKSIAMTHGHLPRRMHEALTSRANLLLHGHLHRRLDSMENTTRVICAGSVAAPRDGLPPVAALLWPTSGQLEWLELG